MAIEVHCDCGNVYTVGVELSGKKLRCKTCNVVLKVPVVPVHESSEVVPPSMEYEVVKDEPAPVVCPTCGAPGKPGDSVCLACGAALGVGGPALVPKKALLAAAGGVILIIVMVVGLAAYRSMHVSSLVATGRDRLDKGELAPAKTAFEEALKTQKDNLDALDGLVQVGITQPNWSLVKNYGERLVRLLPSGDRRGRTLAALARAHLETGEFSQAEQRSKDALKDDASLGGMEDVIALALLGGSKPEAAEALKKADQDGSRDPRIALGLAKLAEPTNVHEARVWLDKASGLAEKDAAIWLECARVREKDGDKTGARGALEQATRSDPKNVAAHVQLARAYLDAKDPKGLEEARAAKAIAPDDPAASRTLGAALLDANDAAGAKAELERAEKLAPDDPVPAFLLGKALIRTGDVAAGVEKLDKALRRADRDAKAWLDAGRIVLNEAKQPEKACVFLEKCLQIQHPAPANPTPEQAALFGEATVLFARAQASGDGMREQRAKRIEETLKEGLMVDPKRRELYVEYGTHLGELNSWKSAQDILERGLATFPDDADILYKAGDAAIKVGTKDSYSAAVEHLQRLVDRVPDYPNAKDRLDVAKRELSSAP